MRVLLIGGAGYVGTELAKTLTTEDADFFIIDTFQNATTTARKCEALGWDYSEVDIRDRGAVQSAVQSYRPTHVIHLAALHYIPYCLDHPTETLDTNVGGLLNTIHAVESLEERPLFIFISSAAIYKGKGLSHENDPAAPSDVYGVSKLTGEMLVTNTLTNYRIARLFNVFGECDPYAHLIPKIYREVVVKNTDLQLGNPTAKRDYVHVNDVARALYRLLTYTGEKTTFNIGTGHAHSVSEVIQTFHTVFQSAPSVSFFNSENMRSDDKPELRADRTRALQELDWEPTHNLQSGLMTLK